MAQNGEIVCCRKINHVTRKENKVNRMVHNAGLNKQLHAD